MRSFPDHVVFCRIARTERERLETRNEAFHKCGLVTLEPYQVSSAQAKGKTIIIKVGFEYKQDKDISASAKLPTQINVDKDLYR